MPKYKIGKMEPGQGEPGTRRGGPSEPGTVVRQRPKPGDPGWVTIMPVPNPIEQEVRRKRRYKPLD